LSDRATRAAYSPPGARPGRPVASGFSREGLEPRKEQVRAPKALASVCVIARVEPLTTARALRGPFDYRLPAALAEVGVGTVLLVPFGRQRVLGVVVEVAERSEIPPERLLEPLAALEAGTPPELVRLGL